MNDRILDLAKQAGLKGSSETTMSPIEQKFSELIVKETLDEMLTQMWIYGIDESNNPAFYKAIGKTKRHFGVLE